MRLSSIRLETRAFLLGRRTDPELSRRVGSLLRSEMEEEEVRSLLAQEFPGIVSSVSFPETDGRGDASVVCVAFSDLPG